MFGSAVRRLVLGTVAVLALTALTASAAVAAPGLPRTYSVQVIENPTPSLGDRFGDGMVVLGDVNSDGEDDLLVGIDEHATVSGELYVFSGEDGSQLLRIPPPDPDAGAAGDNPDAFGTFVPYSALSLFGIRPELISTARGVNLLYQYWIHTDTIRRLGPFEKVLNTPSHHRVHHGANRRYIDRNHGSILIVWDRLFGTFEPEGEAVVYGLTKNIKTFNPATVGTHEHREMLDDVARSTSWRERLSYVLRGPGWAYARQKERAAIA